MSYLSRFFRFIGSILLILFFVSGCTRSSDRPKGEPVGKDTISDEDRGLEHAFLQGQDRDLFNIKILTNNSKKSVTIKTEKGKEVLIPAIPSAVVKTVGKGKEVKVTSASQGLTIDPKSKVSFINNYYIMDYEIKSSSNKKLFDNWVKRIKDFRGFPNTEYEIYPELRGNYLIFYRVSEDSKVPYVEKALSEKMEDGRLKTPLLGLRVEYCVAEGALNTQNERTFQHVSRCGDIPSQDAEYIRVKEASRADFVYKDKADIFLSDYFKGRWFYSGETVVKAPGDINVGEMKSAAHHQLRAVQLVEFDRTSGEENGGFLQLKDASGYKIKEEDKLKGAAVPVNWLKYELHPKIEESVSYFKEEVDKDSKLEDRPYVQLQFDKLAHQFKGDVAETESIYITDDYFSFTIKGGENRSTWYKYSFMKAPTEKSNYVEKRWIKEDAIEYFPTFSINRRYYRTISDPTEAARDKFRRVLRFNPRSEDGDNVRQIKWYFSTQTPKDKWVRDIGRRSVALWNKVFEIAGKGSDYSIEVVLDESEDKQIGDIRYNIINLLYSPAQGGNLLGYGPQMANPLTGESISAIATVWFNNIINIYKQRSRNYLLFNTYKPEWNLFPKLTVSWFKGGEKVRDQEVENRGVSLFLSEKIEEKCTGVSNYISSNKKSQRDFGPTQILQVTEIVDDCARKLAEVDILNTVMHEMGHNFGFRHLFMSSVDEENFYESYEEIREIFGKDEVFGEDLVIEDTTASYQEPARYSSVMDYGDISFPGLTVLGKVDIALARYLYFDKLELDGESVEGGEKKYLSLTNGVHYDSEGEFDEEKELDNPKQESISAQALKEGGVKLKKYKTCGVTADMDDNNPMCYPWDYGTTPLEVVLNYINDLKTLLVRFIYKYDNQVLAERGLVPTVISTIHRFSARKFNSLINNWLKSNPGLGDLNTLGTFVSEEKAQEARAMFDERARQDAEFAAYYKVMDPILDFYKHVMFAPARQCVYEKEGRYSSVHLELIKLKLQLDSANHREIINSCKSPVVQKWAEENQQGELVADIGYFDHTASSYVKDQSAEDRLHHVSFAFSKIPLFVQPNFMGSSNPRNSLIGTDMINSPWFTRELFNELRAYFLEGEDISPYLQNIQLTSRDEPYALELKKFSDMIDDNGYLAAANNSGMFNGIPSMLSVKSMALDFISTLVVFSMKRSLHSQEYQEEIKKEMDYYVINNSSAAINITKLMEYLKNPVSMREILSQDSIEKMDNELRSAGKEPTNESRYTYLTESEFVFHQSNPFKMVLPYHLLEENVFAAIFQKFHKYQKCVDKGIDNCENFENKKAFVQWVKSR